MSIAMSRRVVLACCLIATTQAIDNVRGFCECGVRVEKADGTSEVDLPAIGPAQVLESGDSCDASNCRANCQSVFGHYPNRSYNGGYVIDSMSTQQCSSWTAVGLAQSSICTCTYDNNPDYDAIGHVPFMKSIDCSDTHDGAPGACDATACNSYFYRQDGLLSADCAVLFDRANLLAPPALPPYPPPDEDSGAPPAPSSHTSPPSAVRLAGLSPSLLLSQGAAGTRAWWGHLVLGTATATLLGTRRFAS